MGIYYAPSWLAQHGSAVTALIITYTLKCKHSDSRYCIATPPFCLRGRDIRGILAYGMMHACLWDCMQCPCVCVCVCVCVLFSPSTSDIVFNTQLQVLPLTAANRRKAKTSIFSSSSVSALCHREPVFILPNRPIELGEARA